MAEISLRATAITSRIACNILGIPEKRVPYLTRRIYKFTTPAGLIRKRSLGQAAEILIKENPAISEKAETNQIQQALRWFGLVSPEVVSRSKIDEKRIAKITENLVKAGNVEQIWKIFGDVTTETGIGSGAGVYEIDQWGQIHTRGRSGLEGDSRYLNWAEPMGEKKQLLYMYDIVHCRWEKQTGESKAEYGRMLDRLKFWHIENREEWPEYGLNRQILSRIVDDQSLREAFTDKGRIQASRIFLENCGMNELSRIINVDNELSFSIFKQTVRNYVDSLKDFERDKERLKSLTEHGTADEINPTQIQENFYQLVPGSNGKPLALFLANNHEKLIKGKKIERLFGHNNERKTLSLALLEGIVGTLSRALETKMEHKERERDVKQIGQLLELSNIMSDVSMKFDEKLARAVVVIQNLFRRNGEDIKSSIMKVDQTNPKEMLIAATTIIDAKTRLPVTDRIDISGKPAKISAWVAQPKKNQSGSGESIKDVFVAKGDIFVGGKKQSQKELEDLARSCPELYAELKRVTDIKVNTFMCVPLLSGNDLLGVVSVSGAKLADKDMDILKSAAIILSLAVMNNLQAKDLVLKNILLQKSSLTDQLTGIFNRKYFDSVFPALYTTSSLMGKPLSFLLIDLDGLKAFDDRDHQGGDHILRSVAGWLNAYISSYYKGKDEIALCRYGGDEFAVPLPGLNKNDAHDFALALCNHVASQRLKFTDGEFSRTAENINGYKFTISIGIYELMNNMSSYQELIQKADDALYWRKRNGKNGDCVWTSDIKDEVERIKAEEGKRKQEAIEARTKAEALIKELSSHPESSNIVDVLKKLTQK